MQNLQDLQLSISKHQRTINHRLDELVNVSKRFKKIDDECLSLLLEVRGRDVRVVKTGVEADLPPVKPDRHKQGNNDEHDGESGEGSKETATTNLDALMTTIGETDSAVRKLKEVLRERKEMMQRVEGGMDVVPKIVSLAFCRNISWRVKS